MIAARQHGRVSRTQFLAAGVGRETIARMIRSGWLWREHAGVYAVAGAPVTHEGRWMAAVLAGGNAALLSHRSAVELRGLAHPTEGVVHVTAPTGGRRRDGIIFHRSSHLEEHRSVHRGIPVTSVERTLLDFAGQAGPTALRKAVEAADRLGQVDPRKLLALCHGSGGRKGTAFLTALAADLSPPPDGRTPHQAGSALERDLMRFCRTEGLPLPATNVEVEGYVADCYWPNQGLVVELDGYGFHKAREQFERDRARDAALQLAGLRVMRVTHQRLKADRVGLTATLRRALGIGRRVGG